MKLAVSLIALLGIGFLYSQTRPAILGQKSDAKYRIAVCVDLDGVATTDYLKMNCDRILNSGGQPVL